MSFSSSGSVTALTVVSAALAGFFPPCLERSKASHSHACFSSWVLLPWVQSRDGQEQPKEGKTLLEETNSSPTLDETRSFCNLGAVLMQQGGANSAAFSFKQIQPISVCLYVFICLFFFSPKYLHEVALCCGCATGSSVISQEVKCRRAPQWPGWLAQVTHPTASTVQRNTTASSLSLFPHVQGQVSPKGYNMIILSSSSSPARNDQRFHSKGRNLIAIKISQSSAGAINPCLLYSGGW